MCTVYAGSRRDARNEGSRRDASGRRERARGQPEEPVCGAEGGDRDVRLAHLSSVSTQGVKVQNRSFRRSLAKNCNRGRDGEGAGREPNRCCPQGNGQWQCANSGHANGAARPRGQGASVMTGQTRSYRYKSYFSPRSLSLQH